MSWGEGTQALLDTLEADAALQAEIGAGFAIRNAGEVEDVRIPGLVYSVTSVTEVEVFETVVLQLTVWTRDSDTPAIVLNHRIQARIKRIVHREVFHDDFGGFWLSSKVAGISQGDDPEIGVVRFDIDVELQFLRSKYPLGSTSS
jgi:hypothetical protein